ncbi:Ger(x)C family spore germination protein [Clostridium ganghwense]|uniref:Ger(X)C family spore germination protein n=1 Tax=Clostridium ganghwense TaxID=312089 RepID=A0ABT4CRW2_9CLOT|nr:Ger(x)C family spore germination protein [Clostridium ganghwense]MCY6370724.1 Ger(x)C family spore germination protein [Clostridium ganghwense]
MNMYKKFTATLLIIFTSVFFCSCYNMHPIEDLSITMGIGYDIDRTADIKLVNAAEFLKIDENGTPSSFLLTGEGPTIFSLVENRRTKQSKKFVLGSEILFLISEERAKFGIKDVLENLLRIPDLNINAMIAICKGKCEDYFSLKSSHPGAISETLNNMIKFSYLGNFNSKHFTINDMLLMYHQQGREILLPYIEIIDDNPQITGAAIFDNDKMIKKIPIKEAKLINLLRFSGGTGFVSISSNTPINYLDIEGKNKVKVKVSQNNEQLKYDIFVNISSDLKIDTLFEKELNKKQILKIAKLFESKLEEDLNNEVTKIQKEYPVDCLGLGRYALAKYGINSGYDSYKHFANADIKVHVSVKIKSIGRTYIKQLPKPTKD